MLWKKKFYKLTFTGVWSVLVISAARATGRWKLSPRRHLWLRMLAMVAAAAGYVVLVARETAAALPAWHHGGLNWLVFVEVWYWPVTAVRMFSSLNKIWIKINKSFYQHCRSLEGFIWILCGLKHLSIPPKII